MPEAASTRFHGRQHLIEKTAKWFSKVAAPFPVHTTWAGAQLLCVLNRAWVAGPQ